jgi:hypothetical protein
MTALPQSPPEDLTTCKHGSCKRAVVCNCLKCFRTRHRHIVEPESTEVHWPFAALSRNIGSNKLRMFFGEDQVATWKEIGYVDDSTADRICCTVGRHPHELLKGWFEAVDYFDTAP